LPAFEAPEPAPPRAVTTGSTEKGPVPRPALRPTVTPSKPEETPSGTSTNGLNRDRVDRSASTSGATKDQQANDNPLRKAPPGTGPGSTGGSTGGSSGTPTNR
jgi:hypothetical protein